MPLKLRNRAVETLLTAWAEPWAAFGRVFGLPDESTRARRGVAHAALQNQAHDSIGGCSVDPVHERMAARYDDAEGLGRATVHRVLERLAGRDPRTQHAMERGAGHRRVQRVGRSRAPTSCGYRSKGSRRGA